MYTLIFFNVVFAGFVTDGEYNSLRTTGSCDDISIIKLIMDAKVAARSTPVKKIKEYLTPVVCQGTEHV